MSHGSNQVRCGLLSIALLMGTVLFAGESPPVAPADRPVRILVGDGDDLRELVVDQQEPDPIKAFGIRRSRPVGEGLVIIEGRYLPPPYTVIRRGLEVLINDAVIEKGSAWPLPKPRVLTAEPVRPELPAVENRTEDRPVLVHAWRDYFHDLLEWKRRQAAGDPTKEQIALAETLALVRATPGVKQAEIFRKCFFQLTFEGDERPTNYLMFGGIGFLPPDVNSCARGATRNFDNIYEDLTDDRVFIQMQGVSDVGANWEDWRALQIVFLTPEEGQTARLAALDLIPTERETIGGRPVPPDLREVLREDCQKVEAARQALRRVVLDQSARDLIRRKVDVLNADQDKETQP